MIKLTSKPMSREDIVKAIREKAETLATIISVQQEDEYKTCNSMSEYIVSRSTGYTLLIDVIANLERG